MLDAFLGLAFATFCAGATPSVEPGGDEAGPPDSFLGEWRTLRGHVGLVRSLAFSPDGLLASGGQDRLLCLWDPEGKQVHAIDLMPGGG